ncbi:hypothetical protein COCNU_14G003430 [Cocos nucifera]|uniref:Uncharacterized protein n=1 Tax=Cocos nucifera TaxID=13894 RepID=A0A8K0IUL8_COCNU|nr:hypothetical protein COCNU_14G003430 [Cocos nucifera]
MMRYRVSPDCVPISNGRKNSLRTCKEDDADTGGRIPNYSPFEGKPPRRSGSGSTALQDHHFPHVPFPSDSSQSENQLPYAAADSTPPVAKAPSHHHEINGVSRGSGDVLLQWGHKKRSRGSRAESRAAAGNESVHSRQMIKIQRRSAAAGAEKLAAAAAASAAMPPPCGSYTRGANLRPCLPSRDAMSSSIMRGVEERSGGLSRSEKRSPPSPPEKTQKGAPNGTAADANPADSKTPSDQEAGGSNAAATAGEKVNLENFEWPRIYISLSRKEKEDDFLAMKGTKLPQRPKKRAKNIDKTLQRVSRYRVSPDCVPISNGRKNSLRTCKEDDADTGGRIPNYSPFEGKPPRRSGSGSTALQDHHFPHVPFPSDSSQSENQLPYAAADSTPPVAKAPSHHHEINGVSRGSGDVLLQWGHKKRSRGSRAESRAAAGNESVHSRQMIKIQRRSAAAGAEKLAAAAAASAAMPPPCGSYTRGANLRPCLPSRDAMSSSIMRGVEERSGGLSRSEKRSPPSPPEKTQKGAPNGTAADANPADSKTPSDQEAGGSNAAATAGEKVNLENFEWPRIYISLSRKEKEDDFLAMKGTKLPQRPKKRAKNIDKTLQVSVHSKSL